MSNEQFDEKLLEMQMFTITISGDDGLQKPSQFEATELFPVSMICQWQPQHNHKAGCRLKSIPILHNGGSKYVVYNFKA